MPIYTGPNSVYAKKHGVYCPGPGVSVSAARCILIMMDRELRRGWTYDQKGRRIRMTPKLAARRAVYMIALAKKHYGATEARRVAEIVRDWLRRRGLTRVAARELRRVY